MFKAIAMKDFDPTLYDAIQHENQRQEDHVELIASENYVSPLVLEAQGTKSFIAIALNIVLTL